MIYRPVQGAMWDPSVFWHDGHYYAIMMYNPEGSNGLEATRGLLAVSENGVQWRDGWEVAPEIDRAAGSKFFKAFIAKVGTRFVLDHGVFEHNGRQDLLRFYESTDLRTWSYLFSNAPDPRWYLPGGRWDHMYILPKDEEDPAAGYWGYPVATTRPELPRSLGMMETPDGREWHILPPPKVDWGDIPPKDLEIGGCERIGDRYVIIGGEQRYLSDGYSMYTLIGDGPCGPFRPDPAAFRLCGASTCANGWGVSFLAAWGRGEHGELLISNYVSVPSGTWMLPLRKAIFTDGHLRLGWWPANRALRGEVLPLELTDVSLRSVSGRRQVVWLAPTFDLARGVILEGTIRATAADPQATAGFALQEAGGRVMEIRLGLGAVDGRETHIGRYNAVTGFCSEDVTGQGCATVTGIGQDVEHTFRLLARLDLFELYIDDLLVQTYAYRPAEGRIGLVANGAAADFGSLVAFAMTV